MGKAMNFFGIEISDEQLEAAMAATRMSYGSQGEYDMAVSKALGFEAGDVAPPPASEVNFE